MGKFINYLAAGFLIGLGSFLNIGKADYLFSQKSFVDPNAAKPIAIGIKGIENYHRAWSMYPKQPAASPKYIAYLQDLPTTSDPNEPMSQGDIRVYDRAKDITYRITSSRRASGPDIFGDNLVYEEGDEIHLTNLAALDPNDSTVLPDGTLVPNSLEQICITCGLGERNSSPKIKGGEIIWRTVGIYDPNDRTAKNLWPEIWSYNIEQRRITPVSIVEGNKWEPSKSENCSAYAVYEFRTLRPGGRVVKQMGQWNVYAHIPSLGLEIRIDPNESEILNGDKGLAEYCRSVAVYDGTNDPNLGQIVIAFEKDTGGADRGIGITRLEITGGEVEINPADNPYSIPNEIITGARVDWLEMSGAPGQGPILVWGEYSGYDNGTDIWGMNLQSGVLFPVYVGSGWQYCPDVEFEPNGDAFIVYLNPDFNEPSQAISSLGSSSEEEPEKKAALMSVPLINRPEPNVCGDLGTYYLDSDVNRDCRTDLYDLWMLADSWLESCTSANNACGNRDINKDHTVDPKDYRVVLRNLGESTDPQDPDYVFIPPPIIEPNITVEAYTGDYWDDQDLFYEDNFPYHLEVPEINQTTYILESEGFGLPDVNSVEVHTSGIERILTGPDHSTYFSSHGDVGHNWHVKYEPGKIILSSPGENSNLNPGKALSFALVHLTPTREGKVTVHTSSGPLEYTVQVPVEKTLVADLDNSGRTDFLDLKKFAGHWLWELPQYRYRHFFGDFNNNRIVNLEDFAILAGEYNQKEDWHD